MNVKDVVKNTIKKCGTSNPYHIADFLGLHINRCELGEIRGYYYKSYRIKHIVLNWNLSKEDELFVLSHEIGHAIMHPDANTPFLKENTYLSVKKLEIEANKFAMELLVSDVAILEYLYYTTEQLARLYGYQKELIELRLKD